MNKEEIDDLIAEIEADKEALRQNGERLGNYSKKHKIGIFDKKYDRCRREWRKRAREQCNFLLQASLKRVESGDATNDDYHRVGTSINIILYATDVHKKLIYDAKKNIINGTATPDEKHRIQTFIDRGRRHGKKS